MTTILTKLQDQSKIYEIATILVDHYGLIYDQAITLAKHIARSDKYRAVLATMEMIGLTKEDSRHFLERAVREHWTSKIATIKIHNIILTRSQA